MSGLHEMIGEGGVFQEGFADAAKQSLGKGYEEFKGFDGVKDLTGLTKAFADTKMMVGKKMEGVIQKPGANATDAEKAAYEKSLLAELGPAKDPKDFDFGDTENLPQGMQYSKEMDTAWRTFFHEKGYPVKMVNDLAGQMRAMQIQAFESAQKEAQKQFAEESAAFDKDFKGDAATESNRLAFQAISSFGTEELKALLKASGVYEAPNDHAKWMAAGFTPQQRRIWVNIAKATKQKVNVTDEGNTRSEQADTVAKLYPNSPELAKK